EAVGDHDGGAPGERGRGGAFEGARARAAGLGGGLVEHGDGGIGEHQPGQRELLGAGGRQLAAVAVADDVGERERRLDGAQGGGELVVGGAGAGQAQVVGDGPGEHVHLLGDEGDVAAQVGDLV